MPDRFYSTRRHAYDRNVDGQRLITVSRGWVELDVDAGGDSRGMGMVSAGGEQATGLPPARNDTSTTRVVQGDHTERASTSDEEGYCRGGIGCQHSVVQPTSG